MTVFVSAAVSVMAVDAIGVASLSAGYRTGPCESGHCNLPKFDTIIVSI
ncbi:hypothetical protein CCACVL1_11900 [Corchorus capsularis]|uniref:Uncharacterized protein n=1 Tax=Corchorus capsularis TaxID=210143 RepID=A0A1R3IJ26_COCAP|nr:hypothetical protein CCACVL1_11900 [Corchorus capsularis]